MFRPSCPAPSPTRLSAALLSTLLVLTALPAPAAPTRPGRRPDVPAPAAARARLAESYGRLPLRFEANRGQADARVLFAARGPGYTLALTRDAAELKLAGAGLQPPRTLSMKMVGARGPARVEAEDELPGVSHYLAGPDAARWLTGVRHHARVRYREVYPGIDLAFYGRDGELEYDFVLAPGARPDLIRLRFEGARGARVEPGGDLVLRVAGGEVRQRRPFVYQEAGGSRRQVAGAFKLCRGEVTFQVGPYDPSLPLVIDPVLVYSTFLGGSQTDAAEAIVVDSAGHAHVAGYTGSPDFPGAAATTKAGVYDAFVSKLSADGSNVLYTTYLGGAGEERAMGLALDPGGNVYVTGRTDSADFPTTPGAFDRSHNGLTDAFVTKLDAAGVPVYSTYLGGENFDNGDDTDFVARRTGEIAVDSSGAAYVTGSTQSVGFPALHAFQPEHGGGEVCRTNTFCPDAFLTKLNPEGTAIVYSTFLGGPDSDRGTGVDVDSAGRAYVAGYSWSRFPVSPGAYDTVGGGDAFVVKYDAVGQRLYSTYLGGSGSENGGNGPRLAADDAGHAYVAGDTTSTDFPTTPGAYQTAWGGKSDIFVSKLNPEGTALVFSTYIGGLGGEAGGGVAVDSAANVYVSGSTGSGYGYPRVNPLPEDFASATSDAFLTKLNPSGTAIIYSTVLGGHQTDDARDVDVDGAGGAYVAGKTNSYGINNGRLFPTTTGRPYAGGSLDAFVFKVQDTSGTPGDPTPTPTPGATPSPTPGATPSPSPTPSNGPGSLDPGFGRGGKVAISGLRPKEAWALALQPDGKILYGGYLFLEGRGAGFAVERRNADGSPDPSFGDGGFVHTPMAGINDMVWSVAVAPDGKIVAAGQADVVSANGDLAFGVARYNADGSLDTSFDGDGKVITNLSPVIDHAFAVMVQPDGRIVAAGYTTNGAANDGTAYDFAVVRYNVNGSLDTTFDADGVAQTDFFGSGDRAWDALLQPDGRIVLAGPVFHPTNGYDFGLARYNADGSLDPTFGAGGRVHTPFKPGDIEELPRSVALAPGGKLVAAGWARQEPLTFYTSPPPDFAAARYHPDGSLDATFDGDGRFVQNLSYCDASTGKCGEDTAHAVAAQADGKVIIAGLTERVDYTVLRLNEDGSRDGSFGADGVVHIDFGDVLDPPDIVDGRTGDNARNLLIQPDGRILVGGEVYVSRSRQDVGLARLRGDTPPTPTPTPTPAPPPPPARVNHALAANGAAATASTFLSANRTPLAVINGDRRGLHWDSDPATGSGWTDSTQNAFPDWIEVALPGERSVDEVNVFTVQDNYTAPAAPTEALTFTKYGATAYQVQYWTGSAWAQVPGAAVSGNNRVWRKFTFAPLVTSKLRVVVTGGLTGSSRLTEVEAWGPTGAPPPPRTNYALSSNGATASASSTLDSTRLPAAAVNGDRRGLHWGSGPATDGSGWTDSTNNAFPDWLAITFNAAKSLTEVSVYGLQDNYSSPVEPTEAMTFTTYGLVDFDVEYWTGSAWALVPGGAVRGNNKVWRRVTFATLTTTKIRVTVRKALGNYSRVVEVEAY